MESLIKTIRDEIDAFKEPVDIDYSFDWHNIVKRIKRYKADKYLNDNDAIFYQVVTPLSPHFKKNINIDTKDLYPYGKGKVKESIAWILRVLYKEWARKTKLGITLNELTTGLGDYGFHVFKLVPKDKKKNELKSCDLTRIYFNVKDKDFGIVIEEHKLTKAQIEEKRDVWDDIDKIYEYAEFDGDKEKSTCEYTIYERRGKWDGKRMHHIVAGQEDKEVILFDDELDDDEEIYFAFSLNNRDGALPGVGIYERNFEVQRRTNELVNQNAETSRIASLLLMRTQDGSLNGNVLTDIDSGQIIHSTDLQQIGIDNRALNAFIQELNQLRQQARENCMTPDVVMGETPPSGTPFHSLAAITNAATSAFKDIRDDIGTKFAQILLDNIFPAVVDEYKHTDYLDIGTDDEDIRRYEQVITLKVKKDYLAKKKAFGLPVDEMELETEIQNALEDTKINGRKIELDKELFKFEFGIYVNVTGEAIDKAQQNGAREAAIQMVSANPGIYDLPLFRQHLEDNGISYYSLTPSEKAALNQGNGKQVQAPEPKEDKLMATINSNV